MIRRIICFLIDHDWKTRNEVFFNTRTAALCICHRCTRIEWRDDEGNISG